MSEKPLHVRVAEALGWGLTANGASWISPEPSQSRYDAARCDDSIPPHYDTDWAATGPLIEKYKLNIVYNSASESWEGIDRSEGYDQCFHGRTALEAVCYLILALGKAGKL